MQEFNRTAHTFSVYQSSYSPLVRLAHLYTLDVNLIVWRVTRAIDWIDIGYTRHTPARTSTDVDWVISRVGWKCTENATQKKKAQRVAHKHWRWKCSMRNRLQCHSERAYINRQTKREWEQEHHSARQTHNLKTKENNNIYIETSKSKWRSKTCVQTVFTMARPISHRVSERSGNEFQIQHFFSFLGATHVGAVRCIYGNECGCCCCCSTFFVRGIKLKLIKFLFQKHFSFLVCNGSFLLLVCFVCNNGFLYSCYHCCCCICICVCF